MYVYAQTIGIKAHPVTGNPAYETYCKFSEAAHLGVTDFHAYTEIGTMTETEANQAIQQAVMDKANLETESFHNLTLDHIRGGRI